MGMNLAVSHTQGSWRISFGIGVISLTLIMSVKLAVSHTQDGLVLDYGSHQ
jgi:hypothetical protein